jgi:two-component system chemotaxis response regulator CheB
MLESDPEISIIGTARNGKEGFELALKLHPDLITLDIEMPVMDGLTALKKIMSDCPTSVIMVSSLTSEGADSTIKAMELGAVDFIPKELSFISMNITKMKEDLIHKVKEITRQKILRERLNKVRAFGENRSAVPRIARINQDFPKHIYRAVALGISTGGPLTLQKILPVLSDKITIPIFIVQHMPPKFTKSLAERLDGLSKLEVKEAEEGERVRGGVIYIAPGGSHLKLKSLSDKSVAINVTSEPSDTLHRPSVDVMLSSVLEVYGKQTLGVIMTGMGKDGYEGIKALKGLGGYSIAQDEESCVVYGMPKAIVDGGLADQILPVERIPEIINKVV